MAFQGIPSEITTNGIPSEIVTDLRRILLYVQVTIPSEIATNGIPSEIATNGIPSEIATNLRWILFSVQVTTDENKPQLESSVPMFGQGEECRSIERSEIRTEDQRSTKRVSN